MVRVFSALSGYGAIFPAAILPCWHQDAASLQLDGVIVSNHGGRQLDGVTSTVEKIGQGQPKTGHRDRSGMAGSFTITQKAFAENGLSLTPSMPYLRWRDTKKSNYNYGADSNFENR